jgi:alpha-galactosidase
MQHKSLFQRVALPLAVLCLCAVSLVSCGTEADTSPDRCGQSKVSKAASIAFGDIRTTWTAWALVDGAWQQGEVVQREAATCQDGDWDLMPQLQLPNGGVVTRLELRGEMEGLKANQWWSQGFQSWSQTGSVALANKPSAEAEVLALTQRGDAEVMRGGQELSWFGTVVGGGPQAAVALALTAERWRPWAQAWQDGSLVQVLLVSGGAGEQVAYTAGKTAQGEVFRLWAGAEVDLALHRFGQALVPRKAPAEIGWNSWYELWDKVDEPALRANATQAKTLLQPLATQAGKPLRVVLDDGWQKAWGDWRTNDKFPSGLSKLAADFRAQGMDMGLWLAPLLVDADLPVVQEHPDWWVAGAKFDHLMNGEMRVLDVTHPGARAHLQTQLQALRATGITLFKIDFLFAGTWEGTRQQPVTGMQAYVLALEAIREAVGQDAILLAVGAPPLPTIGRVDAWRFGPDIAVEPFGAVWHLLPGELRTLAVRWPYCHAVLCDADPALLRDLQPEEVGFGAWTVAAAGGGWWLSDDLRTLSAERKSAGATQDWVQVATAGEPAVPEPLLPPEAPTRLVSALFDHIEQQSRHVLPQRWRLPDGRYVLFNAGDAAVSVGQTIVPARSAVLGD